MDSKPLDRIGPLGLVALRAGIGAYFLLAGLAKASGEVSNGVGAFRNSDSFNALQPAWLPDLFAAPYGYVLPWAEIVIGAALALGLFTRISAALTLGMLLSFTIALVGANGLSGGSPGPFHTNFLLMFATIAFVGLGPVRCSIDQVLAQRRTEPGRAGGDPAAVPAAQ